MLRQSIAESKKIFHEIGLSFSQKNPPSMFADHAVCLFYSITGHRIDPV